MVQQKVNEAYGNSTRCLGDRLPSRMGSVVVSLAHRDFAAASSMAPATNPITKVASTISPGASPKYAIYPTIQSDPTNQIAIDKEFGSFPIITPSVGAARPVGHMLLPALRAR